MDTTPIEKSLSRYQNLVAFGLAFIVVFAVSVVGILLFLTFRVGQQAERLEGVAIQTHDVQCALFLAERRQNEDARRLLKESPLGLLDRHDNIIIEASLIQRGIDQRQITIDAVRGAGLEC